MGAADVAGALEGRRLLGDCPQLGGGRAAADPGAGGPARPRHTAGEATLPCGCSRRASPPPCPAPLQLALELGPAKGLTSIFLFSNPPPPHPPPRPPRSLPAWRPTAPSCSAAGRRSPRRGLALQKSSKSYGACWSRCLEHCAESVGMACFGRHRRQPAPPCMSHLDGQTPFQHFPLRFLSTCA